MKKEVLAVLFVGLAVAASGCVDQGNNETDNQQPEAEGNEPLVENENETENDSNDTEDNDDNPQGISSPGDSSTENLPI